MAIPTPTKAKELGEFNFISSSDIRFELLGNGDGEVCSINMQEIFPIGTVSYFAFAKNFTMGDNWIPFEQANAIDLTIFKETYPILYELIIAEQLTENSRAIIRIDEVSNEIQFDLPPIPLYFQGAFEEDNLSLASIHGQTLGRHYHKVQPAVLSPALRSGGSNIKRNDIYTGIVIEELNVKTGEYIEPKSISASAYILGKY